MVWTYFYNLGFYGYEELRYACKPQRRTLREMFILADEIRDVRGNVHQVSIRSFYWTCLCFLDARLF